MKYELLGYFASWHTRPSRLSKAPSFSFCGRFFFAYFPFIGLKYEVRRFNMTNIWRKYVIWSRISDVVTNHGVILDRCMSKNFNFYSFFVCFRDVWRFGLTHDEWLLVCLVAEWFYEIVINACFRMGRCTWHVFNSLPDIGWQRRVVLSLPLREYH